MKGFLVRAVTGIIFVAVLVGGMLYSQFTMMLLFALITGLCVWEFTTLVNQRPGVQVNRFITTVAGVYLFFAMAGYNSGMTPPSVFIPYLVSIVYLLIAELYLRQPDPIHNWAYTMFSQMYVALPFSLLNVLAFTAAPSPYADPAYSPLMPLMVFVFLWMNDTGAYCVGSLLGRHKLFPRISPGKSWEGSIGGALVVLAVAYAVGWVNNLTIYDLDHPSTLCSGILSIPEWLGMGLVVVVFGTWGDLVESLFKRTMGIKDSGNILPGHGGMLDRFDSSLLAIPAVVVYLYTLTLF